MTGPITNFEFGKMQHREYEAEVSPLWGQNGEGNEGSRASKRVKLVLALSGAVLTILLAAQMIV